MTGAIGPGMVLKDMVIPLSMSIDADPVVLSASIAKTLDPPHIFRLERVKSVFGDGPGGYSSIYVENALFDSINKEIISLHETNLTFDVSNTLSYIAHDNDSKSSQFNSSNSPLHAIINNGATASGSLYINVETFQARIYAKKEVTDLNTGGNFLTIKTLPDHIFSEFPTRLKLVQEACISLADFYKCWPLANGTQTEHMGCFSKNGGRLATLEQGITINGPAVILSEAIVLGASDGFFLHRKKLEDHEVTETHVLANNGVKAVMSDGREDVAIECQSFKHIIETRASQFEGGPVVMRRNHVILVAEEEWQFIRVFDYNRVVLSPGKWQMVGTFEPDI